MADWSGDTTYFTSREPTSTLNPKIKTRAEKEKLSEKLGKCCIKAGNEIQRDTFGVLTWFTGPVFAEEARFVLRLRNGASHSLFCIPAFINSPNGNGYRREKAPVVSKERDRAETARDSGTGDHKITANPFNCRMAALGAKIVCNFAPLVAARYSRGRDIALRIVENGL